MEIQAATRREEKESLTSGPEARWTTGRLAASRRKTAGHACWSWARGGTDGGATADRLLIERDGWTVCLSGAWILVAQELWELWLGYRRGEVRGSSRSRWEWEIVLCCPAMRGGRAAAALCCPAVREIRCGDLGLGQAVDGNGQADKTGKNVQRNCRRCSVPARPKVLYVLLCVSAHCASHTIFLVIFPSWIYAPLWPGPSPPS
jgi:hypothetical protein